MTKLKKSAAAPAKASKLDAKSESKMDAKADKKLGKSSAKAAIAETEVEVVAISADEAEEAEESAEATAAAAGAGGNAAALAAAAGTTEMSASFKNFRHHPDMENFYRFIFENDLRHEALAILDEVLIEKQNRRLVKGAKSNAH